MINFLIICITSIIGLSTAQTEINKGLDKGNPHISKIIQTECLAEAGLSLSMVEDFERNIIQPSPEQLEKLRCVPLCTFSKLGFLDGKGNYNLSNKKLLNNWNVKRVEFLNKCMEKAIDPCDKAIKFMICLTGTNKLNIFKSNVKVNVNMDTNTANNLLDDPVTAPNNVEEIQ